MQPWMMMLATGLLYLFVGVPIGMMMRFARWSNKQPLERRHLNVWWYDRLGANLTSIGLAVVLTGFIVDGTMLAAIPVVGSASGLVLAPPLGAAITWGSHWVMAWGKRKAESKIGGPVPPEEED